MNVRSLLGWGLVSLCLVSPFGCSGRSGGDPGTDAGTPDSGTPDAGGDPTKQLHVTVLVRSAIPGVAPTPAASTRVRCETPQGTSLELMTDAEGRVTFDGLEWAMGTASVTAAPTGGLVASRIGITHTEGDIRLAALSAETSAMYPILSGGSTNALDMTHPVQVTASIPSDANVRSLGAWDVRVKAGLPMKLVAVEFLRDPASTPHATHMQFFQWAVLDHAAVTANEAVPVDFAMHATVEHVTGSYRMPTRMASAVRGVMSTPFINVTSKASDRSVFMGGPTTITLSDDGSMVTYEVDFVRALPDAEAETLFTAGTPQENASVSVPGYPTMGEQTMLRMPDPPTTHNPTLSRGLHERIEWDVNGDAGPNGLLVRNAAKLIWTVELAAGATSATVPELPSTVDTAALFGTSSLSARPFFCELSPTPPLCNRSANGRGVELLP